LDSVAAVNWEAYEEEAAKTIGAALSDSELDEARVRFLGRKSNLAQALRGVRDRESGMLLNGIRSRLEVAVEARVTDLQRLAFDAAAGSGVDVTIPGTPVVRGRLHLLTQITREIEDIFLGMGYEVWDGNEVATVWENFDALTSDPGHPSRSINDTFYLDDNTVLRTHTSPDQIRAMLSRTPPLYMVSPGRCYRRDTPDATHSPIFHQVEGLAVDEGITLADLKGTLDFLLRKLFGEQRRTEFRTHYFPFTEPSIEAYVSCHVCDGAGCPVCRHSGWIEVGGAGMVDPKLFEFVGYDPERYTGFAFGWGLERIAMLRHEFPDLRELWRNDLRFARQF